MTCIRNAFPLSLKEADNGQPKYDTKTYFKFITYVVLLIGSVFCVFTLSYFGMGVRY